MQEFLFEWFTSGLNLFLNKKTLAPKEASNKGKDIHKIKLTAIASGDRRQIELVSQQFKAQGRENQRSLVAGS
jgi:hypothetical protein